MAITQTITTSFKTGLLTGVHAFGTSVIRAAPTPDVFNIALYTNAANLDATITNYGIGGAASNEVVGPGYSAGGLPLTNIAPLFNGTTVFISFGTVTWPNATFTANGALIYNTSQGNQTVAVLQFGSDKTVASGTFSIIFPPDDVNNAIIRIT
jgi:hypothetical protein